jgi:hypothetical protein
MIYGLLIWSYSSVCAAAGSLSGGPATPLAPWDGEFFQPKQGGLYLKCDLREFRSTAQANVLTSNIQVQIVNILSRKEYVLTHKMAAKHGPPREIWKLPAGKYEIKRIQMVDLAGVKRQWRGSDSGANHRSFSVKRLILSNLGLWVIKPTGKNGLAVTFKMLPNSYEEDGDKAESSVMAVVDGFTGLVQEKFAGVKLLKKAKDEFAEDDEMRTTASFTRQIAMFYKLDLFKHNAYAKSVAEVLSVYDPNLRACYTNRLDFNDKLRGDVKFAFILSKQTGTMTKLKHAGGSAIDSKLVECMYYELGQMQFPTKETMLGELTYTFDVR